MSANIVELISTQVGGNTNRLSSLLGESPERTQHLVGAAVPTLLAGLTHVASTSEGAHRLHNAINEQDPNLEGKFSSRLADDANFNAETNSTMLTNLFGAGFSTNIVSILGRFTGVRSSSVSSLLGSVTPLALSVIGRESKAMGNGAPGIASYLNTQKSNVAAAMPSGLSSVLGTIPGLGASTQNAPAEPELTDAGASPSLAGSSAGGASSMPETRHDEMHLRERSKPTRWLIPLILLAIVLWAFYAWNRNRTRVHEPEPASSSQPANRTMTPSAPAR